MHLKYRDIYKNVFLIKCIYIREYMERDREIYSCIFIFQLIKEQTGKGL